jgi:hypothetical protein
MIPFSSGGVLNSLSTGCERPFEGHSIHFLLVCAGCTVCQLTDLLFRTPH